MPSLTPAGHILDANTLALWRMDEATGGSTFVDAAGSYNVSVTSGAFAPASGQIGGARTFGTGNNAGLVVTDGVILPVLESGNFTWECWFWIDPSVVNDFNGVDGTIAYYGGTFVAFIVGFDRSGQLRYFNNNGGAIVAGNWRTIPRGTWHHYAVRSTATDATHATIDFFIDGLRVASVTGTTIVTGAMASQSWIIGQENASYFIGRIDDVRFSKVARTDEEIFESYRRGYVGVAADTQGLIVRESAHALKAQGKLLQQYKDKAKFNGLVAVLAGRAQVVEDSLWGILNYRALSSASGQQLDKLGKILNLPRAALAGAVSDEVYRKWLKAQVLALSSNGTIQDLDAIFSFISDTGTVLRVVEYAPFAIVVQLQAAAQTQGAALVAIAQKAKSAGVYCTLDYLLATPAFGFDGAGAGMDTGYFGGSI